jgi:hypothetical protein
MLLAKFLLTPKIRPDTVRERRIPLRDGALMPDAERAIH